MPYAPVEQRQSTPRNSTAPATNKQSDPVPVRNEGKRLEQCLARLGARKEKAAELADEVVLGDESGEAGTYESELPTCLTRDAKVSDLDLGYSRRLLLVRDLGKRFLLEGLDTLTYEPPQLRKMDVPSHCLLLNIARGPGILQCIVELTPDQSKDQRLDKAKVLEGFRDQLLHSMKDRCPAMPLQPNSLPNLMCRSHQMIPALLLREALEENNVKYVYHYMWGMKCSISDYYKHLDDASGRAHEASAGDIGAVRDALETQDRGAPREDDPKDPYDISFLVNQHDSVRSVKAKSGGPYVWCHQTGLGDNLPLSPDASSDGDVGGRASPSRGTVRHRPGDRESRGPPPQRARLDGENEPRGPVSGTGQEDDDVGDTLFSPSMGSQGGGEAFPEADGVADIDSAPCEMDSLGFSCDGGLDDVATPPPGDRVEERDDNIQGMGGGEVSHDVGLGSGVEEAKGVPRIRETLVALARVL